MKYFKYISLLIISLFASGLSAQEQDNDYAVNLMIYNHGDSVSLFWTPATYDYFREGVEKGYRVERRVVGGQWAPVTDLLFPASNEAFEKLSETEEDAGVMQELIYQEMKKSGAIPEDPDPAPVSEDDNEMELEEGAEEQIMFDFGLISCMTARRCSISLDFFILGMSWLILKGIARSKTACLTNTFTAVVRFIPISLKSLSASIFKLRSILIFKLA